MSILDFIPAMALMVVFALGALLAVMHFGKRK